MEMRGQKCNKKVQGSSISILTILWLHFIRSLVQKIIKSENFCAYIAATTCSKFWFKQLHILFFKNEIELEQCSSSIELKIWTIATTYVSLTYFENEWDNNSDASMTHQVCVRGFTMVGLTLSKVRVIISAMAWVELDFIVNLNRPMLTIQLPPR